MAVQDDITDEEFLKAVDETCSPSSTRIAALELENAELRAALYDEKHGITFHARDAILQRWQDHGRQLMASHRSQLPSEARDLYGGGCGCNQCEEVRALLAPNDRAEGLPREADGSGGGASSAVPSRDGLERG